MEILSIAVFANFAVAALFFIFWIVVFIVLYHLTRFGVGVQPKKFAAAFFLGSIAIFCVSLVFFVKIDWSIVIKNL